MKIELSFTTPSISGSLMGLGVMLRNTYPAGVQLQAVATTETSYSCGSRARETGKHLLQFTSGKSSLKLGVLFGIID